MAPCPCAPPPPLPLLPFLTRHPSAPSRLSSSLPARRHPDCPPSPADATKAAPVRYLSAHVMRAAAVALDASPVGHLFGTTPVPDTSTEPTSSSSNAIPSSASHWMENDFAHLVRSFIYPFVLLCLASRPRERTNANIDHLPLASYPCARWLAPHARYDFPSHNVGFSGRRPQAHSIGRVCKVCTRCHGRLDSELSIFSHVMSIGVNFAAI